MASPSADGRSLSEVVQDYLRERILSGAFPPGSRIVERELVESTGVSRIPAREALRALAAEGFVTILPRRGAIVTELKPENLDDIFEIREALETLQVRLAVEKATDEDIAELRECVMLAKQAVQSSDRDTLDRANTRFHDLLLKISHNEILAEMVEPLKNRLHWLLRQNDDSTLVCHEHAAIMEAIAARDQYAAERLAIQHVRTSRNLAQQLLFKKQQ